MGVTNRFSFSLRWLGKPSEKVTLHTDTTIITPQQEGICPLHYAPKECT